MIPDITELNFPKKDGKQYATLEQATVTLADMGEKTVESQIRIAGDITPDFSYDWAVEFQGEKYIMPLRIPAGSKGNDSSKSLIDLTFQHWAIYQLKRWPFVTIQTINAGTYIADNEVASVSLNLKDFCILFGQVLEYYYGDAITIDLNPAWIYDETPIFVEISHTKIWNVLTETLYPKYGVRWEIKPITTSLKLGASQKKEDASPENRPADAYVIRVGYPTTEVSHVFEYGFEGGLLKVERQVQSDEIRNILKGRGGEKNIPFRYFKNTDPDNPHFEADPDWVEELESIYFTNLMGATFRSYIQGWKAQHISDYPGYTAVGESNAYSAWAYRKGYTDTKFSPVEFVADEITLSPDTTAGDKQVEILPGYAPYVKADSSIAKYGPLPDTLDNNDDIYPTLQGTGMDIAVDVEQILTDEPKKDSDATIQAISGVSKSTDIAAEDRKTVITDTVSFVIPEGRTGDLIVDAGAPLTNADKAEVESYTVEVFDSSNKKRSASGIPAGSYTYRIVLEVHNLTNSAVTVSFGSRTARIVDAVLTAHPEGTFDIWVKNVWGSEREAGESDTDYAERVWKPILGDREGNEAKVMFTTGNLVHEDYEFTIVGFPKPDTSIAWTEKDPNGNTTATHTPHWRITLAKSDAEFEATGLYIPNTKRQGKAGDRFVFIGTEMTHVPYVTDAEERLDDWKKDNLADKKEIKPTFVVTPDRVRINNEGKDNALIDQLRVGNSLTLRDKRFIDGSQEVNLYLQSIKYTYRKPTKDDAALNPDVELTLGNDYSVSVNPVSMMQGEITALQRQIGSISNIEQAVRAVGDRKYLRKDRADRTPYRLSVGGTLTAEDAVMAKSFLSGLMGWRIDQRGNAEFESGVFRSFAQFAELIVNRLTAIEGDQLFTEGDTIETVTDNGNGTYTLKLHEKWEGYFTAQYEHNVIKGIYNDITSGLTPGDGQQSVNNALYYTSWMNILSVDAANNEIVVTLYPDDETPAGKNFAPSDMMKIARWGNSGDSSDPECARRQTCMYISSTEGRITKLFRVTKPIIDEGNIACTFGTIPEFLLAVDASLKADDNVLYAKTILANRFIEVDYQGRPVPTTIDRGPWKAGEKYYDGSTKNESEVYERSKVWDKGHGWLCNSDMTAAEANRPAWNTAYWTHVEGDPHLHLEFNEVDSLVDVADPECPLSVTATYMGEDVTSDPGIYYDWTRKSERNGAEDTASDTIWNTAHANGGSSRTLDGTDMNFAFGTPPQKLSFTVTAVLNDPNNPNLPQTAQVEFEMI